MSTRIDTDEDKLVGLRTESPLLFACQALAITIAAEDASPSATGVQRLQFGAPLPMNVLYTAH